MSFKTEFFDVGKGQHMAVDHAGQGSAIILIHGIPGGPLVWQKVGAQLAKHYHVIIPHLLGFAGSSRPTDEKALWADTQAGAITSVLGQLRIQRAVLIGHDFGGPIAAMLLRESQVQWTHVALFATNVFPDAPIPFPLSLTTMPAIGALARLLIFSKPSMAMMLRQGVGSNGPALNATVYLGDDSQVRSIRTIFSYALTHIQSLYTPIKESLAGHRLPALVGWGERDPFFSVEQGRQTAEHLNGNFILFSQAGHFLPEECPNELVQHVSRFVGKQA